MDLDGDGDLDLLSGSWPGELFFFRREAGGSFAAPIMLQDANDHYINIGGGISESDGQILITGNADFETVDGKTFAVYHGKRIESTEDKSVAITGTASAVHACDWDADGDFDLLVGEIGGSVHWIPNLGTKTAWEFGRVTDLCARGVPIRVEGDAGPFAADWDGDGDLDLLVGDGHGSVSLFTNEGSRAQPKLARATVLVPGTGWREEPPASPQCGVRVKVCATDWNGDGKLDLLLGDYAKLKPVLPAPTPEQQQANDKGRAELERLHERYGDLVDKVHGPTRVKDADERTRLAAELTSVREQMAALRDRLPPEEETHGWVWLFLRQ